MSQTPIEAPASITCPDCRQRWQRLHNDQGRAIIHTPIGYAVIYKITQDEEKYFATVRSYADLRTIVGKMELGTMFTVKLCVFLEIVGTGQYRKIDEGIEVLGEDEATEGLWLVMVEVEQ